MNFIVIEGNDGSGKATQSQLLLETMLEKGIDARKLSFPNYQSDSSALVKGYLAGRYGKRDDISPYAAASFYAADRIASYMEDWKGDYEKGKLIIADRYTTSNAIYQCARLPRIRRRRFLQWLYEYEYDLLRLPEPDMVIYLDVDPDISMQLIEQRGEKKDIHEEDAEYMRQVHEASKFCARKGGWERINCCKDGKILPPEKIHEMIMDAILDYEEWEKSEEMI